MNSFEGMIRERRWLGSACFAIAATITISSAAADTIYVPDDYPTIQAAIDASVDGDTVVVADGTYTGDGNRDISFRSRAITVRSENGAENCIIDVQGSDPDRHRAFHFRGSEGPDSVLEGFTIRNGYQGDGGAMYCGSDPQIRQCTFESNTSFHDQGDRGGGAVFVPLGGDPTFVDCVFRDNTAGDSGGAIYVEGQGDIYSTVTLFGCVFEGNTAGRSGGALAATVYCSAFLTDCTFRSNRAYSGGAISKGAVTYVEISRCLFESNESDAGGGAINAARATVIINSLFHSNHTTGTGGAVKGQNLTIANSTFTNNSATEAGAVSMNVGSVSNSVFHGNIPNQIVNTSEISVSYSNIEGGWEGEGNIDEDPMFVDPDAGNFRLAPGSPCIDAGDDNVFSFTDLDGETRRVDDLGSPDMGEGEAPIIDMGAHEFQDYSPGLRLRLRTSCPDPGPARIGFANATPNRPTALLYARNTGSIVIPEPYPCAGTQLGLGLNHLQIAWQGNAGGDGSLVLNVNAPAAACGGYLQLIDIASCETSNVVHIE